MQQIPVGSRFGLWEVISEPSLSSKGKVTATSKYQCRCKCGLEKSVSHENLVYGRSTGCRSCKNSDTMSQRRNQGFVPAARIPNPANPKCPSCGTVGVMNSKKGSKQSVFCKNCNHSFTVDWACPKCGSSNTYKNGYNRQGSSLIQKIYCPECGKNSQVK